MSTKCTIAHREGMHLFEDCVTEIVWLDCETDFVATPGLIRVQLPPDVIDAIRSANSSAFPHLRGTDCTPDEVNQLRAQLESTRADIFLLRKVITYLIGFVGTEAEINNALDGWLNDRAAKLMRIEGNQ